MDIITILAGIIIGISVNVLTGLGKLAWIKWKDGKKAARRKGVSVSRKLEISKFSKIKQFWNEAKKFRLI